MTHFRTEKHFHDFLHFTCFRKLILTKMGCCWSSEEDKNYTVCCSPKLECAKLMNQCKPCCIPCNISTKQLQIKDYLQVHCMMIMMS
jgi:hypothetical protein